MGGQISIFLNGQGGYDNTIAVHPFNEDIVYVGGVDLWRMVIQEGQEKSDPVVLKVEELNTTSYLKFVNFGGAFLGGGLEVTSDTSLTLISVELRFGPGQKQKAHRFSIPENAGTNMDGGRKFLTNNISMKII